MCVWKKKEKERERERKRKREKEKERERGSFSEGDEISYLNLMLIGWRER